MIAVITFSGTGVLETVNDPFVIPAPMLKLVGTDAEVLLLESVTVAPPEGATPESIALQVLGAPPIIVLGVQVKEDTTTG